MSAANVPAIVSRQSAANQASSLTLSYTPSVSGMYRLNAYVGGTFVSGASWGITFGWTDDVNTWSWGPGSGPGVTGKFSQPMTALVKAIAGNPISLVFTVNSGTVSGNLYFVVEDMN